MKNLNVMLLALLSLTICLTSCQKEETLVNSEVEQLQLSTTENEKSGASVCHSCPSGAFTGSQIIQNGDFEQGNISLSQGNTDLSCDFNYKSSGKLTNGDYSIRRSGNLGNGQWCAKDHTTGSNFGHFLVVDGGGTVTFRPIVESGKTYSFCAFVNNLVCSSLDHHDPVIVMKLNGQIIAGPLTLTESPDQWVQLSASFVATSSTAILTIESTSDEMSGNDWALDDVSFVKCCNALNPNFNMAASANYSGQVTVSTQAHSNSDKHWWDIYNSSNGSVNDNSEVPNNSTICCSSTNVTFDNNLSINTWYYIKHGVWNDCISWTEARRAFRVQNIYAKDGSQSYEVEMKDVDFEPTESYLKEMDKMTQEIQ